MGLSSRQAARFICLLLVIQHWTAGASEDARVATRKRQARQQEPKSQPDNNGAQIGRPTTTIENGPVDVTAYDELDNQTGDALATISPAQRLYCNECRDSCSALGLGLGLNQQPLRRNHKKNATNSDDLALECHCRAVYDSQKQSLRCKNMSLARARSRQTGATDKELTAGAESRSQANR